MYGSCFFIRLFITSVRQAFGFHIVEHILLKPDIEDQLLEVCDDDGEVNCPCKDLILLGSRLYCRMVTYFHRCQFQKLRGKLLREELPAHITATICWISPKQMLAFELAYTGFMNELRLYKQNCKWNIGAKKR